MSGRRRAFAGSSVIRRHFEKREHAHKTSGMAIEQAYRLVRRSSRRIMPRDILKPYAGRYFVGIAYIK